MVRVVPILAGTFSGNPCPARYPLPISRGGVRFRPLSAWFVPVGCQITGLGRGLPAPTAARGARQPEARRASSCAPRCAEGASGCARQCAGAHLDTVRRAPGAVQAHQLRTEAGGRGADRAPSAPLPSAVDIRRSGRISVVAALVVRTNGAVRMPSAHRPHRTGAQCAPTGAHRSVQRTPPPRLGPCCWRSCWARCAARLSAAACFALDRTSARTSSSRAR